MNTTESPHRKDPQDQAPMYRWKIFVVPSAGTSRESLRISGQLSKTDLPFEIVGPPDPEGLTRGEDAWEMTRDQIENYHSHIGVMERIRAYGLDYGVILENGAVLAAPPFTTLQNLWDHLPKEADHVQLHDLRSHLFDGYRMESRSEHFNKLACTNVLTIGYVVSSRLAKYLLKRHALPRLPFDHQLIEISRAGIFDFYDINERLVDGSWVESGH